MLSVALTPHPVSTPTSAPAGPALEQRERESAVPTLTETIAGTCFPMFESFVSGTIEAAAREHGHFTTVCSGAYEFGPKFADGGVCLEAVKLPIDEVTLGAGFCIFGMDENTSPFFRVSVGWHRSWTHDRQAGFSLIEYSAICRPNSDDEGRRWVDRVLPSLELATRDAISRRGPPSRLRHAWQRVTRGLSRPQIFIHPSGSMYGYPDLQTFAQTYDREPPSTI